MHLVDSSNRYKRFSISGNKISDIAITINAIITKSLSSNFEEITFLLRIPPIKTPNTFAAHPTLNTLTGFFKYSKLSPTFEAQNKSMIPAAPSKNISMTI